VVGALTGVRKDVRLEAELHSGLPPVWWVACPRAPALLRFSYLPTRARASPF